MIVSKDNQKTYYDGFSIEKQGDQWVARHDFFSAYETLSSNTVMGVMQMIDDFYQEEPTEFDFDEGLEDDY